MINTISLEPVGAPPPIASSATTAPQVATGANPAPAPHLDPSPLAPRPSSLSPPASFPRFPGETPRAYAAFMAYFSLGQTRSLQAVADKTGEHLSTLKNWSAKHDWLERLQAFHAGLLAQHARDEADRQRKHAANWAERLDRFREQEWDAAQKLLAAAQCFLESFGDDAVEKMTLGQVSRALSISSSIGRSALLGAELPASAGSALSPVQQQMLDALARLSREQSSSPAAPKLPSEGGPAAPNPPSEGGEKLASISVN